MTNRNDPNAPVNGRQNQQGGEKGQADFKAGDRLSYQNAGENRSMSLKDALSAIVEESLKDKEATGERSVEQSGERTGEQTKALQEAPEKDPDEYREQDLDKEPGTPPENQESNAGTAGAGGPKTRVFGGDKEELKFYQEPVVGWLVVVGGPGIGAHRPIFTGSNTIGSDPGQRIPIDFGDEYISRQEQAYIRYDADDRQFLFIPNLAKTNVVSIDNVKPTSAVRLMPYDIISMGDTQLVFIPFCGEEFDWSDLPVRKK